MAYSRDNYRLVREAFEKKRAKAQSDAQARAAQVYALHPDVMRLDTEPSRTGLDVMQCINTSRDLENDMNKLRDKNQELQRQRIALLESYGFTVYDLGRDVPPQDVLEAVKKYSCRLVALSALMTTTVPAMEDTVRLLHSYDKNIKVMVGGAVLTREYADMIGADGYSPDAMGVVRFAEEYYGK